MRRGGLCLQRRRVGLWLALTGLPARAADPVAAPPALETRSSPSGRYLIELRLAGGGPHAAQCDATLFEISGSNRLQLWARRLEHRPRPRFALVGNGGEVVLFDEWLAVPSAMAVVLIDRQGTTRARFDLEAVRAALGVPLGALAPVARHGPWMQSEPVLGPGGDAAEVRAAGRLLSVRLRDGALSSR